MKIQLITLIILLNSINIFCQENFQMHVSTTVPSDSRYEIVQSNMVVRYTLKIDKYTGNTYQLTEDKKEKIIFWNMLTKIKHPDDDLIISNINKVNYQFFTSGIAVRYTFLMNINTGATWQLVVDKNDNCFWKPMN